jgi:enoyl-CoA hydratase/carnithine racemase
MATLIAGGAPLAVASTRETLRHGLADAARQAMHHELAEQAALAGTSDAIEGVSAMLEGREPRFEGH